MNGFMLALATATIGMGTTRADDHVHSVASNSGSPTDKDTTADRDTRGLGIQASFEHLLQIRRPPDALHHEFRDGEQVMSGDRVRVVMRTSQDAYVYLAFCAGHKLAVYPSPRGIRASAGARLEIPSPGELVVDDEPGTELLYIIVSKDELSDADPRLAQALKAQRSDGISRDCNTYITASPATVSVRAGPGPSRVNAAAKTARVGNAPTASAAKVLRGQPMPSKLPIPPPATQRPRDNVASPLPDPDYERSARDFVWYPDTVAADSAGIAVVQYTFAHVARRTP